MKRYRDSQLGGFALIGDGPIDLLNSAREVCQMRSGSFENRIEDRGDWNGREFDNWEHFARSFGEPWAEGLATITHFVSQLKQQIPEPP